MAEEEVVLITQLPSDSWFEGFVVRPNGKVLATRLDKPELYTFRPEDPDAVPELVCTLPDCNSFVNICSIPGCDDEYYLLTGTADLESIKSKNAYLWRLTMSRDDSSPPTTTRVASVPEEGYCVGLTPVSERILLIPDGVACCIWHLDTKTGEKTMFAKHESMTISSGEAFFGINRLQIVGNYVYFLNSSGGNVGRIPVELDPSDETVGIRVIGPIESVVTDLPSHLDGLAVSKDQAYAYVASHMEGQLHKIIIDAETGQGTPEVAMNSLDSPTGLNLVCCDDATKSKLYIVCCGEIEMAWLPKDDNPWEAIRDINSAVTVTVTQEVTETIR